MTEQELLDAIEAVKRQGYRPPEPVIYAAPRWRVSIPAVWKVER